MDKAKIERAVKEILEALGENPEREGLKDTPTRVAKMYGELLASYDLPDTDYSKAVFKEETYENIVFIRDINFSSVCEHHMLPFFGTAHIAYIPDGCNLGISKFARIVDLYARRLQLQERLTDNIVNKINATLPNKGVALYMEAQHLCMSARGIKKTDSKTVTVKFTGEFKNHDQNQLFFNLINRNK